jgi:hypothetical protein
MADRQQGGRTQPNPGDEAALPAPLRMCVQLAMAQGGCRGSSAKNAEAQDALLAGSVARKS